MEDDLSNLEWISDVKAKSFLNSQMHLHKLFCTFGLLYGKQLFQEMSSIMVSEGTVKSTSNIALAALVWSFTSLSSMTEVQLPQITNHRVSVPTKITVYNNTK